MLNNFDYKHLREKLMKGYYELEHNNMLSSNDVYAAIKQVSDIDNIIIEIWSEMNAGRIHNPTNNTADTIRYHVDKNRYNVFRAHIKNTYMTKQLIAKALEDLDNFDNLRVHLNLQHSNKRRGAVQWLKEKLKKICPSLI